MDKALKQRLVGATILIALAVIFVPIWVGTPDRIEERDDPIDLPEPPAGDREVRRLPLGDARQSRDEAREPATERFADELPDPSPPVEEPPPEADRPLPEVAGMPDDLETADDPADDPSRAQPEPPEIAAPPPAEPEDSEPPEPLPELEPEPEPEIVRPDGNWLVQVASFGSAESAGNLSDRLTALDYTVVTDTVIRGDTRLHRVRAGPFQRRAEAEQAQARIAADISGVQPTVVSIGGGEAGDGTAPASAGRYAVQVGVFAREENAVQLRDRLSGLGFTTFVDSETGAGRTTWKVRVGPVMERAEAEQLRDRLQSDANVEGMIVSHP